MTSLKALKPAFGLVLAVFLSTWAAGQASNLKEIHRPPLREFHPQRPHRIVLANGMVIFLQEDHTLPLVRGMAVIRGGSRDEPAESVGLVNVYSQTWRLGGTKTRTGNELDDYLESHAARIETFADLELTAITWRSLNENFDAVFGIFLDLLREPEFQEDSLQLAKNQLITAIARGNDNPFEILDRESRQLAYGADSPYARIPQAATVRAITREDLLKWHHTFVVPNNIILGVLGDFDAADMEARLRRVFGSWPRGASVKEPGIPVPSPKRGIYLVQKDDVNQSLIRMVGLGTTRKSSDYYAIEVLNQLFGSGPSSRLAMSLRTSRGLAYYVGGAIGTDFGHSGLLQISLGTKSASTAAAIDALYHEIDALAKAPPTVEEISRAQDAILNSFVFRFDSKEKILREQMAYEFYGYPPDFLERYRKGIEKVKPEDVFRVARTYMNKDQMALLVVGKPSEFDRPLSGFGPVTVVNIADSGRHQERADSGHQ